MFRFMEKRDVFALLDRPFAEAYLDRYDPHRRGVMKSMQDLWLLGKLYEKKDKRIAEIGGAFCRALRLLDGNERWNIEKHQGVGRNTKDKKLYRPPGVKVVDLYLGDFGDQLPDGYFDYVYSISVIEHIPLANMKDFFADHARVLKPGGRGLHAIDFYLGDSEQKGTEEKIDVYLDAIESSGLTFVDNTPLARPVVFRTSYAAAPVFSLHELNSLAPHGKNMRTAKQGVSLLVCVENRGRNAQAPY